MNQESRNNKKRVFISIDLPLEIKKVIRGIQDKIKIKQLKLVGLENIHITLSFLGYLDDGEITKIQNILGEIVSKFFSFWVNFSEIKFFPNPRRVRVIAITIENDEKLEELQDKIQKKLREFNFLELEKRKFKPHITIARVKGKIRPSELEKIKNIKIDQKKWKIESVNLMQSFLENDRAKHEVLEKYLLKND